MIAFLALLTLAQVLPADEREVTVNGQCLYADEVVAQAGTTVLITCGEVAITGDAMAFGPRGFAATVTFVGEWREDQMVVTQVVRRGAAEPDEARGSCRITGDDRGVASVICSAVAGPRSFLANFVVPLR